MLKGGHVIDPANDIDGPMDVATKGDRIATVEKVIRASSARKVIDVSGLYVTPGLIDIHAHAWVGRHPSRVSYPPDLNLASGLTTIVSAGTHGAKDFHLMKKNVIDAAQIRVLTFLNIVATGMGGNEQDIRQMDPRLCAETIKKHRDDIVGIKAAHYWTSKPWDKDHPPWASVERAVEAGELAGVPVMVDFWPRPPERSYEDLILEKLRPGDIHTHVFAQQFAILDENGKVNDFLWKARKRGILFDLGHGAGSFWFRNAVPAIEQGFIPDTISTDLHSGNWNGPVVDMITTMSKVLAMGVPVEDVIRRSTVNPAKAIRRPELGTLTVGREADIAVLELRRGRFGYTDCGRARLTGNVKLENRLTIRAGLVAYDAGGLSMVEWTDAPERYFTAPRLGGDPPSTADLVHEQMVNERR
ncbi:MAG: amidohydrolase/deacetylase family metallohydrolase [bacterium]|nr:amidohydrolase/deacetylase family metallohydrolase [bacterium]